MSVVEDRRESAAATSSAVAGNGSAPVSIAIKRPAVSHYRWTICALLFSVTTLNYMDRQVLALLLPVLQDPQKGIGLTQVQYGMIVSIFSCAYALGARPPC
jgi:ACS family hexuronate transporter-like MFS transporter